MGWKDKITAGAERVAKEAEKTFDKGKMKAEELQIKLEMDSTAKKLGYLVFDFSRGREVDQAVRQQYLDDMAKMEDEIEQKRAEAAAKAQAGEQPQQQAWAPPAAEQAPPPPPPPPPPAPEQAQAAPQAPPATPAPEAGEAPQAQAGAAPNCGVHPSQSDPARAVDSPFPYDG